MDEIRIADLREPVRDADAQALYDMALAMEVDLDAGGLVAAAERKTGLDDFGDPTVLDRLAADHDHNPLDRIADKRFRAALVKAIEHLPEREQHLMGMYYEQEMNFKEIAAVMKVSESRVCQLHGQAVARLRAKLKDW
mgnify:CR=1 FL=1